MNPFQSTHLMGVIKMRRVMKKLVAGLLSLIIIFSVIIPTPLAADNTNVNSPQSIDHNSFISEIEQQEMIKKVQPYVRSEEHTSELQSRGHLVCRLLLEKINIIDII